VDPTGATCRLAIGLMTQGPCIDPCRRWLANIAARFDSGKSMEQLRRKTALCLANYLGNQPLEPKILDQLLLDRLRLMFFLHRECPDSASSGPPPALCPERMVPLHTLQRVWYSAQQTKSFPVSPIRLSHSAAASYLHQTAFTLTSQSCLRALTSVGLLSCSFLSLLLSAVLLWIF